MKLYFTHKEMQHYYRTGQATSVTKLLPTVQQLLDQLNNFPDKNAKIGLMDVNGETCLTTIDGNVLPLASAECEWDASDWDKEEEE